MAKGVLRQASVFGKVFKYRIRETETEFRLPGGDTLAFTNWDVKGVRERFYREEFLNPEVHYNQPKESEPSEFGITATDVRKFIESKEDIFDPLPPVVIESDPAPEPEPISVNGIAPEPESVQLLSEAHSA